MNAIFTPPKVQTVEIHLTSKGWGAGITSIVVDGMDPIACYLAAKKAREWTVSGNGHVLIETLTDRLEPHSMSGDDPLRYRTKESIEEWEKVEPLIRMRIFLEDKKLWNETIEADYKDEVNAEIDAAVTKADSVQKQKISEFIETTFEQPGFVQKEQIEKFREAGK